LKRYVDVVYPEMMFMMGAEVLFTEGNEDEAINAILS
jgi:hypothetical protein